MPDIDYKKYIHQNQKWFNQDAYDSFDEKSKTLVSKLLTKLGFEVTDNTIDNRYAVDLSFKDKDGKKYDTDVEVRSKWSGTVFPFKTIHIPYRKKKFIESCENFIYTVVNLEMTHCLMCKQCNILASNVVTIKTPRMEQEPFYDIDVKYFKLFEL